MLIRDLNTTDPEQMHYKLLAKKVRLYKETKEGIKAMSSISEEFREEGRIEGRLEGSKEASMSFAYKAVMDGTFTIEKAKSFFGLTDDEMTQVLSEIHK